MSKQNDITFVFKNAQNAVYGLSTVNVTVVDSYLKQGNVVVEKIEGQLMQLFLQTLFSFSSFRYTTKWRVKKKSKNICYLNDNSETQICEVLF